MTTTMSFPVLCWATAGGVTSEEGKSEVEGIWVILLHSISAYNYMPSYLTLPCPGSSTDWWAEFKILAIKALNKCPLPWPNQPFTGHMSLTHWVMLLGLLKINGFKLTSNLKSERHQFVLLVTRLCFGLHIYYQKHFQWHVYNKK